MLKHHVTAAIRDLRKHPLYACANAAGLAIGIACCLLVFLYALDSLKYDRFHEDLPQLYRIHEVMDETGVEWASAPWAPAEILQAEYEGRLEVTRLRRRGPGVDGQVTVRQGDRVFVEQNFFFADSSAFDVLTFPFVAGDRNRALRRPRDLVLTEEMAAKYFGEESPLGRPLLVGDAPYTVTGILKNLPQHSHLQFGFLASMESTWNPSPDDGSPWRFNIYYTYVKVPDQTAIPGIESRLRERQQQQTSHASTFKFFPVRDIHLNSQAERELAANGDIRAIYFLSIIGAFLLAIACINFINLATARSAERAREVGVRKALGAGRAQLARQFLCEALLLSAVATLVALVAAWAALPLFNSLIDADLAFQSALPWWMPMALLGTAIVVGLLAGSYPAFYLSALQPVKVLKGRLLGGRRALLRHGLVTSQFGLSFLLIIGTLVISRQLDFMRGANLAVDKEQVLVLSATNVHKLRVHYATLKEELKKVPGVRGVTSSDVVPGERLAITYFAPEGAAVEDSLIGLRRLIVDDDFAHTYGLQIIKGRDFTETAGRDERRSYIVNEAAVEALGWEHPIGKRVDGDGEVVGVVKDFHYASLHRRVEPMIMSNGGGHSAVSIKIDTQDLPRVLAGIEQVWIANIPNEPFNFYFLEDRFERLYHREATLRQAVSSGTVLAIFIACLGLFGLASFTIQQRTKEIGIRKVLGSSVVSIVNLLSKDFLKPVGLAFLIAAPVAYLVCRQWLQSFEFRIEIGAGIFLIAGLLVVSIALLTVSFQAVKAALADPVESLRYE